MTISLTARGGMSIPIAAPECSYIMAIFLSGQHGTIYIAGIRAPGM
jgi:hypothetical protein